ncbi:hypothetical protein EVAR_63843_1 [Eumeta japonica]|uniref:Uncharacterized protein n=1 Tax=Eumeta variegata TaxID=151549 RepID=A0A4C1YZY3_EUMVA|nr:hypothetical protein EVAR_63843_1 [Eumeta japonica]
MTPAKTGSAAVLRIVYAFSSSINNGSCVIKMALRTTCKDDHLCQQPAAYVTVATIVQIVANASCAVLLVSEHNEYEKQITDCNTSKFISRHESEEQLTASFSLGYTRRPRVHPNEPYTSERDRSA